MSQIEQAVKVAKENARSEKWSEAESVAFREARDAGSEWEQEGTESFPIRHVRIDVKLGLVAVVHFEAGSPNEIKPHWRWAVHDLGVYLARKPGTEPEFIFNGVGSSEYHGKDLADGQLVILGALIVK
jgi:hypothetical protein